jgi:PAS domain S-box-containing protein
VLSGLDDERLGIEAVRSGAQDYIVKGKYDKYLLTRAINHAVQRHQLLMELELSKERLRAQYKWMPVPTYTWEKQGSEFILVDQNIAAQKSLGHVLAIGAKASDVFKDYQELLLDFQKCYESRKSVNQERELRLDPEDTIRHYNVTHVFVPPNIVMLHAEDMTSKKAAEQALRQSEERFRTIFEGAQDLVYIKDKKRRYTHVNPSMERTFEMTAAKFIGKTDEELFGDESSAYIKDVDLRVLRGELIEEEHTRKIGGIPQTFNEVRVPMRNSQGSIIGLCGIARNMTERKMISLQTPDSSGEYPSEAMRSTLGKIRIAADKETTILLLGESGSGKDYLARYIHEHSKRVNGPFFAINCAAVAPELAESELFGHERGAFTGAHGRKRGLLELAEGGTLLLNEIGELSPNLQAKLLTFLDTREFTRVGGEKNISVNARLIAATNRDLEKEVEAGRFRKDLFYRLNVISIIIPPLRDRREDIPILIHEILARLKSEIQLTEIPDIDANTMNALMNYHWPGNVRELRNVLERSLMLADGKGIYLSGLGFSAPQREWSLTINFPSDRTLNDITREMKSSLVNEALRRSGGSRQGAARLLGISRYSLKHYMNSLNLNWGDDDDNHDLVGQA